MEILGGVHADRLDALSFHLLEDYPGRGHLAGVMRQHHQTDGAVPLRLWLRREGRFRKRIGVLRRRVIHERFLDSRGVHLPQKTATSELSRSGDRAHARSSSCSRNSEFCHDQPFHSTFFPAESRAPERGLRDTNENTPESEKKQQSTTFFSQERNRREEKTGTRYVFLVLRCFVWVNTIKNHRKNLVTYLVHLCHLRTF